ncbi:hypothetical protein ACFFJB_14820 [Camelimonas abortus]|uniref:Peptidase S9 prolyl oligopeptidase catalytic domain-containing protein n=1 Tax=Camelimonas abortus TaxID=1017184 RepID=A0ABV7LH80_9HYPH
MGNEIPPRYFLIHGSCDGLDPTIEFDDAQSLAELARQINGADVETIFRVWEYSHSDGQMRDVTEDVATELALNSYRDSETPSFAAVDLIDSYGLAYYGHYQSRRSDGYADYRNDMRMAAE